MTKKRTAPQADSSQPKKPRKTRAKAPKSLPDSTVRLDALHGKRFTHRKRAEWGIGTVVGGAENAIVLAWSDGTERRTARSYMDQLVEAP